MIPPPMKNVEASNAAEVRRHGCQTTRASTSGSFAGFSGMKVCGVFFRNMGADDDMPILCF